MTDEELDKARADEAYRIVEDRAQSDRGFSRDVADVAARLAREGWTPPAPVDPLFAEMRKIVFDAFAELGFFTAAAKAAAGAEDDTWSGKAVMAALKRGIEIGKTEARPMFDADGDELCWHRFPGMKLAELMSTVADAKRWNTAPPTGGITEHKVGDIISVMGWKFFIDELSIDHQVAGLTPPHSLGVKPIMEVPMPVQQGWRIDDEVLVKGKVIGRGFHGILVSFDGKGVSIDGGNAAWCSAEWLVRP